MVLKRKHIKRNTMTWAYSSREFGIAKQLQSDIMDPLATEVRISASLTKHPFQPDDGHAAAFYLGRHQREGHRVSCNRQQAGMDFFQKHHATWTRTGNGKHIQFVTPKIGFPMQQYYRQPDQWSDKIRRLQIQPTRTTRSTRRC